MRIFARRSPSRLSLALITAISLTIAVVMPAYAVHDVGLFQLDRNAQTSVQSTPVAAEDWDMVCPVSTPPGAVACIGGTTAQASTFDTDGVDATIFTGGGSKDDLNTTSWQWKNGSVPPKDDLAHAYAARYASGYLYFGADRTFSNGDAQLGFWFFQGDVGPQPGGTFGPDAHQNGDILVLSDFTQGGTTVTIRVYEWHSPGGAINGTLDLIAGTTGSLADCVGPPPVANGDHFCATVNSAVTPSPWSFTDKGSTPTGYFGPGEFYEGGIDLGFLGLQDECFSSFLAETRSSQSVDATLKDFVSGSFAVCNATMSTAPSTGAGGTVTPGTIVTDTATVIGSIAAKTPTGDVTFYLCGPIATGTCETGTQVGLAKPLSGSGGTATATSDGVDTTTLAAGRYCFRATWPGDSNYPDDLTHSGTGDSECFYVAKHQPSIITTPSAGGIVGVALTDTATLSGGFAPITGTVTFNLYAPGDTTCTTSIGSSTGTVSGGSASSGTATIGSYTTTAVGVYQWTAVYNGDANNLTATSGCGAEPVTTTKAQPSIITTPSAGGIVGVALTDTATLSGGFAPITGTVTFNLYAPGDTTCTTSIGSSTGTVSGGSASSGTATIGSYTTTAVGVYQWTAVYNGDANNLTATSGCGAEPVTVTDTSSTVTAQDWLPNDSATITTGGGSPLNGTLSFTLYESGDCSGTVLRSAQTFTLTNAASGSTFNTTNTTVRVLASTTVSWGVIFTSSDPFVGSSNKCEVTTLTILN